MLDERLVSMTGTVAEIARELVAWCRALNQRVTCASRSGVLVNAVCPDLTATWPGAAAGGCF